MDRINFSSSKKEEQLIIGQPDCELFGLLEINNVLGLNSSIEILPRTNVDLLIKIVEKCETLNIFMGDDSYLNLQIMPLNKEKNLKISGTLSSRSQMKISIADFSSGSGLMEAKIILNGIKSTVAWHLSSLASDQDKKIYSIKIDNLYEDTKATMSNLGVIEHKSNLTFLGQGHIVKGAKNAQSHQVAKILVFDSESVGKVDPVLKIDENEVMASHSASVGRVNEEHLFYLRSRGLNEIEAKKLLMMSFLQPVISFFTDEKDKKTLSDMIEERI
jgi:Fe-S cluster assembly protein SufD